MNADLAFTLAFFALIIICIAATGIAGFLYLLYKELVNERGPDPEPPVWVNHATPRRRCHR